LAAGIGEVIDRRDEKPDPEQSEGAVLRNEVTNGNPCLP